jgi:hypothetical protein
MGDTQWREPELVTIIKRLADLEARAFLAPGEMRDLNALRQDLQSRWPEVSAALAHAYLAAAQ